MREKLISGLVKQFASLNSSYRFCSTNAARSAEVCIVGGGMVGLYSALAFGSSPLFKDRQINLIEGAKSQKISVGGEYSNRVVALSPRTREILQNVGAWEYIEKVRRQPVRRMQVWEDQSESFITLEKDAMESEMAYIVENSLVLHALTAAVTKLDNVEILYERKLESLKNAEHDSSLVLNDGTRIQAGLVVGCDGFNSKVRQLSNIHTLRWDHDQKGIVATLELEEESNDNSVAWQRFLKTGPIAILPLDARTSSLVWSTTFAEADRLLALSEDDFVQELNSHLCAPSSLPSGLFGSALTQVSDLLSGVASGYGSPRQMPPRITGAKPGSRAAFPLGFMHASNYVAPGVALVGDAAHRVLPLAGQGVNLGFGDAHCLVRKMEKCVYDGEALGQSEYLRDFESERQRFVVPVMATIEALFRLYSSSFGPVVFARGVGLQAVNALPMAKNIIVNGATSGELAFQL